MAQIHFGILAPPAGGHLNTILPLGCELKRRGHQVTVFGIPDTQSRILAAGLEHWPVSAEDAPPGHLAKSLETLGRLEGLAALRYTINLFARGAELTLRDCTPAIEKAGIEALLIDQTVFEGSTLAERLGIPFITICSALPLNPDLNVPPFFFPWPYSASTGAKLRNLTVSLALKIFGSPHRQVIDKYRCHWNLPPTKAFDDTVSPLALISHQPAAFEFPRASLPRNFHFTGPFASSESREPTPFPFERLTGQPLIYASMGTVQNRIQGVFKTIASACADLNAQLAISLGGSLSPAELGPLPGNPLVVQYAPQLELLQRAAIAITHAGLNTTLECLKYGVPMVAIPIANDQPGVGARIAWTGCGEVIPLAKLTASRLREAVNQVLTNETYKANAQRLQRAIQESGGVSRAADIVEKAIATREAVLADNSATPVSMQ